MAKNGKGAKPEDQKPKLSAAGADGEQLAPTAPLASTSTEDTEAAGGEVAATAAPILEGAKAALAKAEDDLKEAFASGEQAKIDAAQDAHSQAMKAAEAAGVPTSDAAAAEPAPAAKVTAATPEPEAPATAAPAPEAEVATQNEDAGTDAAAAEEPAEEDLDAEADEQPQAFIRFLEDEAKKAEKAAQAGAHAWLLGLQGHLTGLKLHLEQIPEEVHVDLHEFAANVKSLF